MGAVFLIILRKLIPRITAISKFRLRNVHPSKITRYTVFMNLPHFLKCIIGEIICLVSKHRVFEMYRPNGSDLYMYNIIRDVLWVFSICVWVFRHLNVQVVG